MDNMNWSLLRYALFTYRKGSASGAAESLNVTHATVIRGLKRLEEETDTKLFSKSPTGYMPTESGRLLINTAEKIEAEIYQWKRNIEKDQKHPKGLLRITTTEAIMNCIICPILEDFYKKYPEVNLEFSTSYGFDNITNHEFDIALRSTSSPSEHLIGRKVKDIQWGVYQSNTGNPDSNDWIGYSDNSLPPAQWMSDLYPNSNIRYRASSILSQLAATKAGLGKSIIPAFVAEHADNLTTLQKLPNDYKTQLWALYHIESRNCIKVTAFVKWLYSLLLED